MLFIPFFNGSTFADQYWSFNYYKFIAESEDDAVNGLTMDMEILYDDYDPSRYNTTIAVLKNSDGRYVYDSSSSSIQSPWTVNGFDTVLSVDNNEVLMAPNPSAKVEVVDGYLSYEGSSENFIACYNSSGLNLYDVFINTDDRDDCKAIKVKVYDEGPV